MIQIKDATLLDILPHTFDTDNDKALSAAIASLSTFLYTQLSSVLFWADIENADAATLDAMAAELDAPFYSSDMSDTQKRSVIAAAFAYNSRIGTPSSITELLSAAFGNGTISEWYNYGGDPYYFKADIVSQPPLSVTRAGYELFISNLDSVIPKRAKLEKTVFTRSIDCNFTHATGFMKTYRKFTVPAGQMPDEERGIN